MHRVRITPELSIVAVAAAVMASLVLVAGTYIEPSAPSLTLTYTFRPALCTTSYCDPPELILTSTGQAGPPVEAALTSAETK